MIDIIDIGTDLLLFDSQVAKGTNVLGVQLGSLEYAPDFGIDLKYFLSEEFEFQNEAFRSYLIQRLAESAVDVSEVIEQVDAFETKYTFNLAGSIETNPGLVR